MHGTRNRERQNRAKQYSTRDTDPSTAAIIIIIMGDKHDKATCFIRTMRVHHCATNHLQL